MRVSVKRCLVVLFSVILCLLYSNSALAHEGNRVVKVGFFHYEGYHMVNEKGEKSGYGYEYIQQMAKYNQWKYEYIGYDASWAEIQTMLESGELDLITSAQKTPEREELFDFSEKPIGNSSTILTVKAGNRDYSAGDYTNYNGIRVGLLEGNSRNLDFEEFAAQKKFSYEVVWFENLDEMHKALRKGKQIDAIATSNLRAIDDEWILDEFAPSPFYVMVRKNDHKLLQEINNAISQITTYLPGLQTELFKKYYTSNRSGKIPLTAEERIYLETLLAQNITIKALINPDRAPLAMYEDGQIKGILHDISQEIIQRTGLPIEIEVLETREEYYTALRGKEYPIRLDASMSYYEAERNEMRLTDAYFSASLSQVTRRNFMEEPQSIAAVREADVTKHYIQQFIGKKEIIYYDTAEECIDAIRNGDQDATYLYTYMAQEAVYRDERNRLKAVIIPNFYTDFVIGIDSNADYRLLTILNKAANSIDAQYTDQVVGRNTDYNVQGITLMGYLYSHPVSGVLIVFAIAVFVIVVILYLLGTKNQKLEKERSKEFTRFISVVCKANDAVIEVDFDAKKQYEYRVINGEVKQYENKFTDPEHFFHLMHEMDYNRIKKDMNPEKLHRLVETEKEYMCECRLEDLSGEYRWYSIIMQGMGSGDSKKSGRLMLFVKYIHDKKRQEVEQRQTLEDALNIAKQASEAKGIFTSRMSHEIRTPLNAVIGYIAIVLADFTNAEKVKDYLNKAQAAAKHLLNIVNDVLDISSIEGGKLKIANETFDFKQVINNVTAMFYSQAKQKGIRFETLLQQVTHEKLVGDSLRVNQILLNLLSNAMKFTPEGGCVTLTIAQLQTVEGRVYFRLTVEDNGVGMTEEFQKKLFSPFEQQDATTARKYGGSGLGLSITKNLITMMNGAIEVSSKEGKGTAFQVNLSFGKGEECEPVLHNFKKVRALVVDDEESSCEYMQKLLERCGIKSDVAYSGKTALRMIEKRLGTNRPYNLFLMDWNMPEMDGIETARRIKELCVGNSPMIIATAYDYAEIEEEAKRVGVDKIVSKPLFQSSMFDILVNAYGKYEPKREADVEEERYKMQGVSILLAEDNEMNMEIAIEILSKAGLVLTPVRNGQEALDAFTQSEPGRFQAVLMDIQMPIMDGYEATKLIRASLHPQAKEIPIIAMTANAFAEDVAEALSSGMSDHISKPIDYKRLFTALSSAISKK